MTSSRNNVAVSEELDEIDGQIADLFRALSLTRSKTQIDRVGSWKSLQGRCANDMDVPYIINDTRSNICHMNLKIPSRREEVKELEYTVDAGTIKTLNEKKQSMVKELNSYVALKKQYASNIENKRVDLITRVHNNNAAASFYSMDLLHEFLRTIDYMYISAMTNQQLMDNGHQMMDETDQAIERSKKVVHETVNVGTETAAALKAQTEQMSRIVNELDSIHFSIKKASQLVKEIGRQGSNIENKRVDLFGGPAEGFEEDNGLLASSMTNQQLMDNGHQMMDETDQAIERSKKVVHETGQQYLISCEITPQMIVGPILRENVPQMAVRLSSV
nr:novel plant SNARE 11 [Tanacetum cinerariifolium]